MHKNRVMIISPGFIPLRKRLSGGVVYNQGGLKIGTSPPPLPSRDLKQNETSRLRKAMSVF